MEHDHQVKQVEHEIKSEMYHSASHDAHYPMSIRMTAAVSSKMHNVAAKHHRRKAEKEDGKKNDVKLDKEESVVNGVKHD